MQKFIKLIRVAEHYDWVIYCIVGIVLSYIIIFKTLHRDVSLLEFILQPYENTNNNILSWVFTTILFSLSFAVLFSQFIPIVPKFIPEFSSFNGVELNKIGFLFVSLLIFYLIKNIVVYIFFGSVHQLKKFSKYSFVAQKYYLVYSLVLNILSILHYYTPLHLGNVFNYYVLMAFVAFVIKIFIYLFHNQQILPTQWYYKFLYICTLQILPSLVIWKFWFL